jgi:putative heme iron utilization protein
MKIDSELIELESNTKNANSVKEIVIATLLENGIINEEQASEYVNNWQVIIFKRSWFERWANFFKKDDLNAYQYKFVKFEETK